MFHRRGPDHLNQVLHICHLHLTICSSHVDTVLQKVKPDVYAVVDYLKAKGVTSFGTVGFCWGAAMSVQAAIDSAVFKAAALLHPSLFNNEKQLCSAAKVPLAVVSAQGE